MGIEMGHLAWILKILGNIRICRSQKKVEKCYNIILYSQNWKIQQPGLLSVTPKNLKTSEYFLAQFLFNFI